MVQGGVAPIRVHPTIRIGRQFTRSTDERQALVQRIGDRRHPPVLSRSALIDQRNLFHQGKLGNYVELVFDLIEASELDRR